MTSFRLKVSAALLASTTVLAASPSKTITVDEGTDMQVTVSPDCKTILADIQGLIFSIPFRGGAGTQLTQPVQEASHPNWSAKGDLVALQSYAGGTFHVWTMKPDGTELRQVTTGHGDDREPRFSPDGSVIVFASDRAFKGSYDIWTVHTDGSGLKQITSSLADEYEPSWSPDGKRIAFVSGTGVQGKEIDAIDLATGQQTVLASVDPAKGRLETPSFSPDGTKISYTHFEGQGLFVNKAYLTVASVASQSVPLYVSKYSDAFPFPTTWLSNSELIYTANGKILHVNLGKGTESAIPFRAAIASLRPTYTHKHYDFDETAKHRVKGIYAPSLSPDGSEVAFIALNQLYLMKIGQPPVAITHDAFYKQGPIFSWDGKWLAYVSDRDDIENVYIQDLSKSDSASDRRVAPSENAQIMPAWSPDGKLIAFQDQTGATLLADLASGKISPLAPATFFPGRAAFAPNGKTIAIATIHPYSKRFREGTSDILIVDLATRATRFYSPSPYESVTTRTEDGPIYAPNGKEMAFVLRDLLYTMPVDAEGRPCGAAVKLNDETTDEPTWSGDSSHLLYLSNGKLRLIDRSSGKITPVPVDLSYSQAKPQQKLLIHAGRFWKGAGADELKDVDILITDNRITSVQSHSSDPPAGVMRTVEAPDSTVMPGLFENHVHADSDNGIYYGDRMGRLWLAYGITELRGIADNAYRAVEHKEAYLAGAAIGPRVFNTGEAVDGERVYYPMMIATTSEVQLHREFDRLNALGFDFVKLYVRLPYAWAKEGIDYAHSQMGVETASHYLLPAVALGEDGMSHISATVRTGWAYSRSVTGRSYGDVTKLMVDSGMWTITTTFSQAPYADDPGMGTDPRQQIAPPWENKRLRTAIQTATHTDLDPALEHLKDEESTVAAVFEKGGLVLAGTDSPLDIPATSLHLNLRAQVKYGGLKPWQALETATVLPAKAYGLSSDLGTLEPGHLADLIIVAGDPLRNIEDAARVECVAKNGILQSVGSIMAPFAKSDIGDNICSSH